MKSYEMEQREEMRSAVPTEQQMEGLQDEQQSEIMNEAHQSSNSHNGQLAEGVALPMGKDIETRDITSTSKAKPETSETTETTETTETSNRSMLAAVGTPKSEGRVKVEPTESEDEGDDATLPPLSPAQRPRFTPPTREQVLSWLPFWGVILLGAVLRFWGLGDKPLHHDESLHAFYSLQLMHNMENWASCFSPNSGCYQYNPLLHGPFQFHAIALVYKISQLLGVYDHGVNTTTVRIAAATLGTLIVALPFFLRDYLGKVGAWTACFLLAVSPSMVYFSRFAREDIYMACFTLLMVVAVARYIRDRKMGWLITASIAFALSYATKEATFLSIAIFGSFLGALIAWELGLKWPLRTSVGDDAALAKYLPRTGAPVTLSIYFLLVAPIAKFLFGWMKDLSIYITNSQNTASADLYVQGLKDKTVAIVPWIGIILGIYVLSILAREMFGKVPPPGRHGLAKLVDPERQTLLDTIVTMPWTHWFFAVLCGWAVFLVLFTVLFTNIRGGIGDGIWQGLYYWLQQQQVARGGQPWYYYLLLIPLYEQIGLVFGIVGLVRCLVSPTRFRLFLVYWFVGNVFIYTWAAEKMPWLMIHMTMPMMLLAAIGLEPIMVTAWNWVRQWYAKRSAIASTQAIRDSVVDGIPALATGRPKVGALAGNGAAIGLVLAILLLLPTLHNMYEVSYVHPADGPHEMMVYVQTTTDVNTVMAKVDAVDQKLYGGEHKLYIGLMNDATWPFAWYVRDYPNVCYNFPTGCSANANSVEVIIAGGDNLYAAENQYGTVTMSIPIKPSSSNTQQGATANKGPNYLYHQYHMRTWWDEGYKPPPCVPTKTMKCDGEPTWGGVGAGLWLSYGDTPPPGAKFDLGKAANNIWQWWWNRKAIGSTDGAYDMALFIRSNVGVAP